MLIGIYSLGVKHKMTACNIYKDWHVSRYFRNCYWGFCWVISWSITVIFLRDRRRLLHLITHIQQCEGTVIKGLQFIIYIWNPFLISITVCSILSKYNQIHSTCIWAVQGKLPARSPSAMWNSVSLKVDTISEIKPCLCHFVSFSVVWRHQGHRFGLAVHSESVGSSRSWPPDIHETICVKKRKQVFEGVHHKLMDMLQIHKIFIKEIKSSLKD